MGKKSSKAPKTPSKSKTDSNNTTSTSTSTTAITAPIDGARRKCASASEDETKTKTDSNENGNTNGIRAPTTSGGADLPTATVNSLKEVTGDSDNDISFCEIVEEDTVDAIGPAAHSTPRVIPAEQMEKWALTREIKREILDEQEEEHIASNLSETLSPDISPRPDVSQGWESVVREEMEQQAADRLAVKMATAQVSTPKPKPNASNNATVDTNEDDDARETLREGGDDDGSDLESTMVEDPDPNASRKRDRSPTGSTPDRKKRDNPMDEGDSTKEGDSEPEDEVAAFLRESRKDYERRCQEDDGKDPGVDSDDNTNGDNNGKKTYANASKGRGKGRRQGPRFPYMTTIHAGRDERDPLSIDVWAAFRKTIRAGLIKAAQDKVEVNTTYWNWSQTSSAGGQGRIACNDRASQKWVQEMARAFRIPGERDGKVHTVRAWANEEEERLQKFRIYAMAGVDDTEGTIVTGIQQNEIPGHFEISDVTYESSINRTTGVPCNGFLVTGKMDEIAQKALAARNWRIKVWCDVVKVTLVTRADIRRAQAAAATSAAASAAAAAAAASAAAAAAARAPTPPPRTTTPPPPTPPMRDTGAIPKTSQPPRRSESERRESERKSERPARRDSRDLRRDPRDRRHERRDSTRSSTQSRLTSTVSSLEYMRMTASQRSALKAMLHRKGQKCPKPTQQEWSDFNKAEARGVLVQAGRNLAGGASTSTSASWRCPTCGKCEGCEGQCSVLCMCSKHGGAQVSGDDYRAHKLSKLQEKKAKKIPEKMAPVFHKKRN